MHLTGAQQGSACERLKRALQHSAPMSEPSPAAEGTSERANVGRPEEQDAETQMNVPPGAQTYAQRTLGKESGPTAGLQCAADVSQCAAAAPATTRKQSGDSRIARLEREMQELQERNAQLDAAAQKAREEADELYTSAKLLAEEASAKQQHLEARLRSAQEALQLTQQAYKDERQRREEEEAIIEHSLGTVFQRSNQLQHDAMRCGWSSDGSPERLKRLAGIDNQEFDFGTREAGVGQGTTQTMDGLAAGWVEREPGLVERNPVPGERSELVTPFINFCEMLGFLKSRSKPGTTAHHRQMLMWVALLRCRDSS
ncbi:hypothetical protein AB1Y20_018789 [Prymnesium parvum]|uniref:Uncharacterized protein n=1 Tax=Prymnesium parvum TaxID=97485 RepID=A0AB34JT50_PRYPA